MMDRVGQQLGNYQLIRLLGEGGFAEVYLAEHIHLGTQAAIKVLHTQLASDEVERFRTEARTIARLVHPHIVRVLDFGIEDKTPFLVMDYAPHGTLRQLHPKGSRLPLDTLISYVKQIAEALQYAHDQRVIHRDVKPENMLLGRSNAILLSDFGIALIAQSSRYQRTQEMAGTLAYMAPEQIQGHPHPASDQYSLGIVVYEWLSGDIPFHGSMTEIVAQHLAVPPPALHEKVPTIPPAVEQVVLTALKKDPLKRFASVQPFATALEQAAKSLPKQRMQIPTSNPNLLPTLLSSTSSTPAPIAPTTDRHVPPIITPPGPAFTSEGRQTSATRPPRMRGQIILLIGLVLLVIAGSVGFFAAISSRQAATISANATATVNARGLSSAKATATAHAQETATARANLTATVVFQATATALAEQNPYPPHSGTPTLNDPLSDNSRGTNWYDFSNSGNACQFAGGVYHVIAIPYYGMDCLERAVDLRNFTYEVQMKFVKLGDSIGIIFRADQNSDYYYADFYQNNGEYILGVCKGTNPGADCSRALARGPCPAFHYSLHVTNTIAIVVNGMQFDLYVNGQHIAGTSDGTYTHGLIGMSIADSYTTVQTNAEAVFSNAKVWTLPE